MSVVDRTAAYALLGVSPGSDADTIRAAWHALVRTYHPDLARDDREAANARLADINAAFDLLAEAPSQDEVARWRAQVQAQARADAAKAAAALRKQAQRKVKAARATTTTTPERRPNPATDIRVLRPLTPAEAVKLRHARTAFAHARTGFSSPPATHSYAV